MRYTIFKDNEKYQIGRLKNELIAFWVFYTLSLIWDNTRTYIRSNPLEVYSIISPIINFSILIIALIPLCFFYHHLRLNKSLHMNKIRIFRVAGIIAICLYTAKLTYALLDFILSVVNYLDFGATFNYGMMQDTALYMLFLNWIIFIELVAITIYLFSIKK